MRNTYKEFSMGQNRKIKMINHAIKDPAKYKLYYEYLKSQSCNVFNPRDLLGARDPLKKLSYSELTELYGMIC